MTPAPVPLSLPHSLIPRRPPASVSAPFSSPFGTVVLSDRHACISALFQRLLSLFPHRPVPSALSPLYSSSHLSSSPPPSALSPRPPSGSLAASSTAQFHLVSQFHHLCVRFRSDIVRNAFFDLFGGVTHSSVSSSVAHARSPRLAAPFDADRRASFGRRDKYVVLFFLSTAFSPPWIHSSLFYLPWYRAPTLLSVSPHIWPPFPVFFLWLVPFSPFFFPDARARPVESSDDDARCSGRLSRCAWQPYGAHVRRFFISVQFSVACSFLCACAHALSLPPSAVPPPTPSHFPPFVEVHLPAISPNVFLRSHLLTPRGLTAWPFVTQSRFRSALLAGRMKGREEKKENGLEASPPLQHRAFLSSYTHTAPPFFVVA